MSKPIVRFTSVAAAFSAALLENPQYHDELKRLGVKPGQIHGIERGSCGGKIFLMLADKIEKVTGLDLQRLMFDQAKHELWGSQDRLPDVSSHSEFLNRIRILKTQYGTVKLCELLGINAENLSKWLVKGRRPTTESYKQVLSRIQAIQSGSLADPTQDTPYSPEEQGRRELNACLSSLHTMVTVLEIVCQRELLVDGDRARTLDIARRMMRAAGLTPLVVKRLHSTKPLSKQDRELLGIPTQTTASRGRRR
ncbi:MAG: hypothetical protein AAB490_02665 [Patescibacteria group bacterium]